LTGLKRFQQGEIRRKKGELGKCVVKTYGVSIVGACVERGNGG